MDKIRFQIKFEGNVQGVGFRWTAVNAASEYKIDGWIRNLSDGSVELLAEGQERELEAFISRLRLRMANHIRREIISTTPATGEFSGFSVHF